MATDHTVMATKDELAFRNHVHLSGQGPVMMFAHGLGCDQTMWRHVVPAFADHHQILLFDQVGSGLSDRTAYRQSKYQSLRGYAEDVVELLKAYGLRDVIFVGHSVSGIIGLLAAIEAPECFKALVMLGASARYVDDDDYRGGFSREDVMELLQTMTLNYEAWARQMAPVVIATDDRPELSEELAASFVRTDPVIMRHFAQTTFLSDARAVLHLSPVPSLILQSSNDVIVPLSAGEYLRQHLPHSTFQLLEATGHYPHLSAPEEIIMAVSRYLADIENR